MNREEIIQAKDKLNHCIEFYENMCEPREVQPILTGEEKKALKSLLRYNDNLEQQCKKQKEVIDKATEYILECSINEKGHINVSLSSEEVGKLLDILNEALE